MELIMKNRLFSILFILILFSSKACQAWSFAASIGNAVRSTLGFRLMTTMRTKPKAYAARLGTLAGLAHTAHKKSDFPLNCKILDQELKNESSQEPLTGNFSLSAQLRIPFDDQKLEYQQLRNYAHYIKQNQPFPLQFGPISGSISYCSAEESKEPNRSKTLALDVDAHGMIKCERGNNQCNNRLYLYSKLSNDFTRCLRDEFGPFSLRKPRSVQCTTLYDALRFDADEINPLVEIDDLTLNVGLD
jgi:hypothetical protein